MTDIVDHDTIWLQPACCGANDPDRRFWSEDGVFDECDCAAPSEPVKYVRADLFIAAEAREMELSERLKGAWADRDRFQAEAEEARASANHQRKQKQASNISRNRAVEGCVYWKAQAEAYRLRMEELEADKAAMDWLESMAVEVRDKLVHGSRHLFYANPDDSYEGEIGPSPLRERVIAALLSTDTGADHVPDVGKMITSPKGG